MHMHMHMHLNRCDSLGALGAFGAYGTMGALDSLDAQVSHGLTCESHQPEKSNITLEQTRVSNRNE
jgi:hypothetical protein